MAALDKPPAAAEDGPGSGGERGILEGLRRLEGNDPRESGCRIGCGAGFSSDRLGPAVDLLAEGGLDWLVLECIGERTMAFGHRDRRRDPNAGYNPLLEARMRALLPLCRRHGTRLLSNMGVANPRRAAERTVEIAGELGLRGLTVAWLEGDEVTDLLGPQVPSCEGDPAGEARGGLIAANAYLGIEHLLPALATGADVVLTGRVADPSLFLAPLVQRFGWAADDWDRLAAGTLVGHLLECGMQVTGGYFADPGRKEVPDLARCGYPIAEVTADGGAVITKLTSAGGLVSTATVKEQLLYEVHDPSAYVTPDVIADFSAVTVEEIGRDRVRVAGARGRPRPGRLKVTLAFDGGWLGEAGVSYAGINALARAELAREILKERLVRIHGLACPLRFDLIGVDSLHGTAGVGPVRTEDVRLRVACRSRDRREVELVLWETEAILTCGPAGGGGFRGRITESVTTASSSLPREAVRCRVEVLET